MLRNVTTESSAQTAVAEAGGIPPLVKLLSGGADSRKENAAGCIRNLSIPEPNRQKIVDAGGVPLLVTLITSGNDGQKEQAAAAIRGLACNGSIKPTLGKAGAPFPCEFKHKVAVKNNLHQNITLISPVSAGLLNVSEKPPEDSKSKCFERKNSTLLS